VRSRRMLIGTALAGLGCSTVFTTPALAKHRHVHCNYGYQVTDYHGRKLKAVWRTVAQNHGGHTDTLTVTVDRTGTVSTKLSSSVEAQVGGGFAFFSASIKAQLGFEITHELSTHTGQQYSVLVPPHREVIVRYGVFTRQVRGILLGHPLEPNQLYNQQRSHVPVPKSCSRRYLGRWHATVTLPETGFSKTKPHRI
jgi:hypothetical protein